MSNGKRRRTVAIARPSRCLIQQERYEEAEPLLVQTLPTLCDIVGVDHYLAPRTLQNPIEQYQAEGRSDRATEYRSMLPECG